MYMPDILVPLAATLADQAKQTGKDLKSTAVVDEIACQLYRRHRGELKRRVRERTWDALPPSEKGKYRKIANKAIKRFLSTR